MASSHHETAQELLEALFIKIEEYKKIEQNKIALLERQEGIERDKISEDLDIEWDEIDGLLEKSNKKFSRLIGRCNHNLETLAGLQIMLGKSDLDPAIKISTFYQRLQSADKDMANHFFPPKDNWKERISSLLKQSTNKAEIKQEIKQTETQQTEIQPEKKVSNTIEQLIFETKRYRVYLETNKIGFLQDEHREKVREIRNKYKGPPDKLEKKLEKLETEYDKKIEKYQKEKAKIEEFLEKLQAPKGNEKSKLGEFQKDFKHWKEHDMKWRMFRSKSERGKGLYSLQVKKILINHHQKAKPAKLGTPSTSFVDKIKNKFGRRR